jgi:hypothetical protein
MKAGETGCQNIGTMSSNPPLVILTTPRVDDRSRIVEDNALADISTATTPTVTPTSSPQFICVVPILTPTDAYLPALSTNCDHSFSQHADAKLATSPTQISPAVDAIVPPHERLMWRLASAFFAYFLCGWGDGGQYNLPSLSY